jgi:pimeloyl-ACP methyl ester carboxylesterase
MNTSPISKVTSRDGTTIAYEQLGSGPTVILVGGAFCDRNFAGPLPALLQADFTVVSYDRRGRGDSGDTAPYAADREIEDLQVIIAATGGSAYLFGVSSGAMLALEAAVEGLPVRGLALVEPPYRVDDSRPPLPNLAEQYTRLCAAGRPGEAVALFMTKAVGQPPEAVAQIRDTPMWSALEAMAPTLAYDATIVGDAEIPASRIANLDIPALAIESTASPQWLRSATRAIVAALPQGKHVALPGQFHQPDPEALATELRKFFRD